MAHGCHWLMDHAYCWSDAGSIHFGPSDCQYIGLLFSPLFIVTPSYYQLSNYDWGKYQRLLDVFSQDAIGAAWTAHFDSSTSTSATTNNDRLAAEPVSSKPVGTTSTGIVYLLLAICRPSGCTAVSGVVIVVGGGVCNWSQMRTSKCTCLIFDVIISLDPG